MVRERARDLGKWSGHGIKRDGDTRRSWAEGTQWGGEGKKGLCSPPPWRVWASGELKRLWREKTGTVHGTDPNSPPPSPTTGIPVQATAPARCAVPMCKLSCPPIARSQVYFPATRSLCGTWTHQSPAAMPAAGAEAAAAVLQRWVHKAAWWEVRAWDLSAGQPASASAL